MAFDAPFDTIRAEKTAIPGVSIEAITGDEGRLSLDPTRNTAGIAASYVLRQLNITEAGVKLTIHKGLPLASGLGSSAASAAGGAVAVNALFGDPIRRLHLLEAALEGEAAVSGRHADNVAPALLGGIVLVAGLTPDHLAPLPIPVGMVAALVTPDVAVPTAQARAALPKQVPMSDLVRQTAAVAQLIAALYRNDLEALGRAMEADIIVEPARRHLMPGLAEVRAAARERGALGTFISGAGPTLCSICDSEAAARRVADGMELVYARLGLACQTRVTRPAAQGVRIVVTA
jgi:homoserine kinase